MVVKSSLKEKNTIRDVGSTTLQTSHLYTVFTDYTVYSVFTASIAHSAYAVYIAPYTACLNTADIVYTADILLKQCVFLYMSILL